MRKFSLLCVLALCVCFIGCGKDVTSDNSNQTSTIQKENSDTSGQISDDADDKDVDDNDNDNNDSDDIKIEESITEEQALSSIKKYCHESNPDLEDIEKEGKYEVGWKIDSSSIDQIVVLYRSYTGAKIRYYIDTKTGDTYVTEFAPGISEEEEKTDESFNVRDYIED